MTSTAQKNVINAALQTHKHLQTLVSGKLQKVLEVVGQLEELREARGPHGLGQTSMRQCQQDFLELILPRGASHMKIITKRYSSVVLIKELLIELASSKGCFASAIQYIHLTYTSISDH